MTDIIAGIVNWARQEEAVRALILEGSRAAPGEADRLSDHQRTRLTRSVREGKRRFMRYVEFRDAVRAALRRNPAGLTWMELKQRLELPYDHPCPSWVKRLEEEVGLSRVKGTGRAYVWTVPQDK